ncbi:MAG: PQQ-binding-like beta-propeller repeat protein [Planctomycetaceae bacterium]
MLSQNWKRIPFAGLLVLILACSVNAAGNWPGWRGPLRNGHSSEKGFPTKWSSENLVWETKLKGEGQSSPVIWGDRIFLTASENRGAKRWVMCINRNNGELLWEKLAWTGTPEPTHRMNGWASSTCVTDGKHVYAFFGRGGGLFCYTMEGELVWKRDLGPFVGPWGTAASPILVGNLIIQNCDADKDAYIAAFDKNTGKPVWKTSRENKRGWSSPILIKTEKRDELVINGHSGARAYDPHTGKELWFCKGFNGRGSPTITQSETGLLHVVNGLRGDIYAVRPGGNGTVTNTHMAWHTPRGGARDLPSPIAVGKYLLVMNMQGILTCYDTATGKELSKFRIGGKFSAAPVAWQGLAFFINEDGETVAIQPGEKPKVIARSKLEPQDGEIFRSSITPSNGRLYIRSTKMLYCIGKPVETRKSK